MRSWEGGGATRYLTMHSPLQLIRLEQLVLKQMPATCTKINV